GGAASSGVDDSLALLARSGDARPMASCSVCGAENSEQARFCQTCGTSLGGMEPGQESRRTVTAVFVDIVGSTALAERLDTETTTRVLDTYFGRMKDIVAR